MTHPAERSTINTHTIVLGCPYPLKMSSSVAHRYRPHYESPDAISSLSKRVSRSSSLQTTPRTSPPRQDIEDSSPPPTHRDPNTMPLPSLQPNGRAVPVLGPLVTKEWMRPFQDVHSSQHTLELAALSTPRTGATTPRRMTGSNLDNSAVGQRFGAPVALTPAAQRITATPQGEISTPQTLARNTNVSHLLTPLDYRRKAAQKADHNEKQLVFGKQFEDIARRKQATFLAEEGNSILRAAEANAFKTKVGLSSNGGRRDSTPTKVTPQKWTFIDVLSSKKQRERMKSHSAGGANSVRAPENDDIESMTPRSSPPQPTPSTSATPRDKIITPIVDELSPPSANGNVSVPRNSTQIAPQRSTERSESIVASILPQRAVGTIHGNLMAGSSQAIRQYLTLTNLKRTPAPSPEGVAATTEKVPSAPPSRSVSQQLLYSSSAGTVPAAAIMMSEDPRIRCDELLEPCYVIVPLSSEDAAEVELDRYREFRRQKASTSAPVVTSDFDDAVSTVLGMAGQLLSDRASWAGTVSAVDAETAVMNALLLSFGDDLSSIAQDFELCREDVISAVVLSVIDVSAVQLVTDQLNNLLGNCEES